jgi:hypothetical protein
MLDHHRVSGRQIMVMVLAVCVAAVLAPVGVYAASRSTVSIADGAHPSRLAKVTSHGAQVVNVTGATTVGGSVTAVPGAPGSPFAARGSISSTSASTPIPTGKHVVIQTVSISVQVPHDVLTAGAWLSWEQGGIHETIAVPLPLTVTGTSVNASLFSATVPAALYPDPGSTISLQLLYNQAEDASGFFTVTGYRV